jgi:hypothetical protein
VQTFGIRLLKTNGFFMPNASNCEGRVKDRENRAADFID